jgi:hypothetical protein
MRNVDDLTEGFRASTWSPVKEDPMKLYQIIVKDVTRRAHRQAKELREHV